MSEEEKKIKEMEELGIRLIDSPSETVAKASPTKLKLQALTFMVIGKIERYFLGNMLKQAKEARNLAEVGLRKTDMTLDDKMAFKEYLDSNITLLEEKMALFDKNYKRVIGRGKRSLKIPSTNIKILFANGIIKKHKQKTMIDMVDAYKQMNDVFSTAKTEFSGMPKPIKRDVEVSKAEQDNIKQAVYEALSNTDDKEVEKYASNFDKTGELVFLHKVLDGPSDQSYGINVASLAKIPTDVTLRAQDLLEKLEAKSNIDQKTLSIENYHKPIVQVVEKNTKEADDVLNLLKSLNPDDMKPIDALVALSKLKAMVNEDE